MTDINHFFLRKGVNLDITYRCTLECPACTRYYLKQAGKKIPGHDMTDDEFDIVLNKFDRFMFCGNISDPIFHPNFIGFLTKIYAAGKQAFISTAASHKPIKWYKKAFECNPTAKWIFGIDGLPHKSFAYRINQDGEKLFDVMVLAKELGLQPQWQYIIFSYNEDSVDEARELAKKHDIEFLLCKSSRFPNDDKWMTPSEGNRIDF